MRIFIAVLIFCFFSLSIQVKAIAKELLSDCNLPVACATQSVVSLLPDWPANFSRNEEPEGSAIVIAPDLLATANHVLGPAKSARIRTINGVVLPVEIVMRNPETDVAFLRIKKSLPTFKFAQKYTVADKACAVGNSFGLDVSITCGVVSARGLSGVGFNKVEDFVQTDASVNPGMSGGALVDRDGKLVGMLSAIFTRQSDANIGVNFAVSVELLKQLHADFMDDGTISIRKSGILLRPTKPDDKGGMIGAEVVRVQSGSLEEIAGIQSGDILYSVNGNRLKRAGRYEAILAVGGSAKSFEVRLLRGEEIMLVTIPAG